MVSPHGSLQFGDPSCSLCTLENDELLGKMKFAPEANRALTEDAAGCLDGTRTEVVDAIVNWAIGGDPPTDPPSYLKALVPETRVLWVCGLAGEGKSSIATTVAKRVKAMGLLGSVYSFQGTNQAALNPKNLFSTISRHLAKDDVSWKSRLLEIIRQSDEITHETTSPTKQFDTFILAPGIRATIVGWRVIVIDAFDEAGNRSARAEILRTLTRRAGDLPDGLRIIITSRTEDDVMNALSSRPNGVVTLMMHQLPHEQTESDIQMFVADALKDNAHLNQITDANKLKARLVQAAGQLFQWASAACRYINNEDDGDGIRGPGDRLRDVLESGNRLDELYATIFNGQFGVSQFQNLKHLLPILGPLAYAREPLSLEDMVILGSDSSSPNAPRKEYSINEYHRLVRKLSSLLTGTQDITTPIVPLHASFVDFLRKKISTNPFDADGSSFNGVLASHCMDVMRKHLRFNICGLPTSFKRNRDIDGIETLVSNHISKVLSYACRFWPYHFSRFLEWHMSMRFVQLITCILSSHMLEWLEVMSLTGSSAVNALEPLSLIEVR